MSLDLEFLRRATEALELTRQAGYRLEPYRGFYTARQQAILWKKSRTEAEAEETAKIIEREGAPTIARLLRETKALPGRRETDLLPGQSWHQHGEALDVRLIGPDKKAIWSPGHHGYETFAKMAIKAGLTAGYFWRKKDANHVQLRAESVRAAMSWEQIDEKVRKELEAAPKR